MLQTLIAQALSLLQRHPKAVSGSVATVLLSSAALAVASFTPLTDDAAVTVQQISYSVQPLALEPQEQALETQRLRLFRTELTRSSDTVQTLLARLGVNDDAARDFLRSDTLMQQYILGRAGKSLRAEVDDQHALLKLSARWPSEQDGYFQRLVVEKTPHGWQSHLELAPFTVSTRLASGTIQSSLFAATDAADIPDAVALQIAEIFSGDIDFHRALQKGDRFSVVYETLEADGEPLRSGNVVSAEFQNNHRNLQAIWFQEPGQKGAYYTPDGQSMRRAFLTSPLQFSRVTSGFKMRFHPILKTWRAHLGVDYAATTGTPVRTVGDGVVEFAGQQNGFGNVVMVKHRGNTTTVYAHLSKILVRRGQAVSQSENVGLVGSTGWATGPHLHFEFRVNGTHRDPLTMAREATTAPISGASRSAFAKLAHQTQQQLAAAAALSHSNIE